MIVSVSVYVHSPWRLQLSGLAGMPGNRSSMLCWRSFFPMPNPFIATLEWSTKPFLLASLSCSPARNGLSHDLTRIRLALCLHLPLSGIALAPHNFVNQSRGVSGTHERGRNITVKDYGATNFSNESSPRQST